MNNEGHIYCIFCRNMFSYSNYISHRQGRITLPAPFPSFLQILWLDIDMLHAKFSPHLYWLAQKYLLLLSYCQMLDCLAVVDNWVVVSIPHRPFCQFCSLVCFCIPALFQFQAFFETGVYSAFLWHLLQIGYLLLKGEMYANADWYHKNTIKTNISSKIINVECPCIAYLALNLTTFQSPSRITLWVSSCHVSVVSLIAFFFLMKRIRMFPTLSRNK